MDHNPDVDDHGLEPFQTTCRLLACSEPYGRRLIAAGELRAVKVGKYVKVVSESRRAYVRRLLEDGACG